MKTITLNNNSKTTVRMDAIISARKGDLSGMPLLVLNVMGLIGSAEMEVGYFFEGDVEIRDKDLAAVIAAMESSQ